MKYLVVILFFLSKLVMALSVIETDFLTDSITPPPEFPSSISGTTNMCVGETAVYTSDIPLGCEARWYINSIIQSSTTGTLEVLWTDGGDFNIDIYFECDTNTYFGSSLLVTVNDLPAEPAPIEGNTAVCIQSSVIYTTEIGEDEFCQWEVDGIIQPFDSTMITYLWSNLGFHTISVSAVNNCGLGNPVYLEVMVYELPIVNLGNDTTIIEGQSLILDAGNPGCTFLWSTGDTAQTIIVAQSGNYEVVVSNTCGDVLDNINVDVVVDINEKVEPNKLLVRISGNNIYVNIKNSKIRKVKIWDMGGRLIIDSTNKPFYYIPGNGTYIVNAVADDGVIFACKVIKY